MARLIVAGIPVLVLALVAGLPGATLEAQAPLGDLEVTAPPAPREGPVLRLEPQMPPWVGGLREQDFYPDLVRSRHEPAFLAPFVAEIPISPRAALRLGLSAWTAPAAPFDSADAGGGPAFGWTVQWGLPGLGSPVEAEAGAPPVER